MKPYIHDEIEFTGKYSKQVFQTIYLAVRQYKNKFIFCFLCGILGRFFLLLNTNILGLWADNLCHGTSYCQKKSTYFSTLTSHDFINFLLITTGLGFLFLLAFRIWIARLGTYSSSFLYDETTYRVSRYPISFFDKTPVGRMITRFTSDYAAIIRMTGGPLGEFVSITIDLFLFCILTLMAGVYFLPVLIVALALNYCVYYLNKSKIRQNRRDFSVSRGPVLSHFAESVQGSKIIRVFGKEKIFINVFLKKFDQYVTQKNKTNITKNAKTIQKTLLYNTITR